MQEDGGLLAQTDTLPPVIGRRRDADDTSLQFRVPRGGYRILVKVELS